MTIPLRAAIIGTGRIASLLERDPLRSRPHTHAGWYAAHSRTTLVAGCDIEPERLQMFAADWGVAPAHLYDDHVTMLERERPDIVSVCAYATDRVPMCRAALASGARGLWIEKAVACSVDEGRQLSTALTTAGCAAIVDHPRRHQPRYRSVARWIQEERFGRLESVHVLFSGHIIHTGTHAWDLLLAWCGPWQRVHANLDALTRSEVAAADGREHVESAHPHAAHYAAALQTGVADRGGRARIVFANGVEAAVTGGAKEYFVFQCDLVFARGRVRIGNDLWEVLEPADSPRYTGYRELTPIDPDTVQQAADQTPQSLLDDLIAAIDSGRPPVSSVASAVDALALGIAIMQSGITGQTITPDTLDPSLRIASI